VDDDLTQAAARHIESTALVSLESMDRSVAKHRLHITSRILALHCPNPWCQTAFREVWLPHNPTCESCTHRLCPLCLLPLHGNPAARRLHPSCCPPAGAAAPRDAQRGRRYAASVGAYLLASVEPRLRTPLLDSGRAPPLSASPPCSSSTRPSPPPASPPGSCGPASGGPGGPSGRPARWRRWGWACCRRADNVKLNR
jgi:hypothetical protein